MMQVLLTWLITDVYRKVAEARYSPVSLKHDTINCDLCSSDVLFRFNFYSVDGSTQKASLAEPIIEII